MLGALIAPLLALSDQEPEELRLLRRAGGAWRRGLDLAESLKTARIEIELSLARTDLPDALTVLQMGLDRLASLHAPVIALRGEIETLRREIDTLAHIPRHPRQADRAATGWGLADLFAGRRSLAFVQALVTGAQGRRQHAFAAGALAGYAGHVAGSAWLGAVVGGPRRLHRFRDRLARNTTGEALRDLAGTAGPGDMAGRLWFEGREEPTIPPDLLARLSAALSTAWPGRTWPDLAVAHARMIEHLQLLGGFAVPPPPEPPPIVPDPAGPATIETLTFDQSDNPPQGGTITLGPTTDPNSPGTSSQKSASGDICIAILIILATFGIAYLLWCIGRLTDEKKCGIEDFFAALSPEPPDPTAPQTNTQMLETLRKPGNANHILNDIYQLQLQLWHAFAAARSYLLVCGLISPDADERQLALFRQFLKAPVDPVWPHREDPDAVDGRYIHRPTTPAEAPTAPLPFPPERDVDWLLVEETAGNTGTIGETVISALAAIAGSGNRVNLDLDADRGRLHAAWTLAAGTSIEDQPLAVVVLGFGEQ